MAPGHVWDWGAGTGRGGEGAAGPRGERPLRLWTGQRLVAGGGGCGAGRGWPGADGQWPGTHLRGRPPFAGRGQRAEGAAAGGEQRPGAAAGLSLRTRHLRRPGPEPAAARALRSGCTGSASSARPALAAARPRLAAAGLRLLRPVPSPVAGPVPVRAWLPEPASNLSRTRGPEHGQRADGETGLPRAR